MTLAVVTGHAADPVAKVRSGAVEAGGQPTVRAVPGLMEPLVASGPTTAAENGALEAAIAAFRDAAQPGDLTPLARFIAEHPTSAWRLAVLTNLGLAYYQEGYFSRAMTVWE